MIKSDSIKELATALAKAQGEMEAAKKDSTNPHYKSSYADLASISDACRPVLAKNGIAHTQTFGRSEHGLQIETTLIHSSGQWISSALPVPASSPANWTWSRPQPAACSSSRS